MAIWHSDTSALTVTSQHQTEQDWRMDGSAPAARCPDQSGQDKEDQMASPKTDDITTLQVTSCQW